MPLPESTLEFSRPIAAERIGSEEFVSELEATPAERARLIVRFDLVSLDRLVGRVRLRRRAGGMIAARGHLEATLAQRCVVTLEPVPQEVSEDFTVVYAPAADLEAAEVVVSPQAELQEPLEGDSIDLGELLSQQLGVALDPYPRAPGVAAVEEAGAAEEGPQRSPFAALEKLAGRLKPAD